MNDELILHDVFGAIAGLCPRSVDIYFDNVGVEIDDGYLSQ